MRILNKMQAEQIRRAQLLARGAGWNRANAEQVNMGGYGNGNGGAVQQETLTTIDNQSRELAMLRNAMTNFLAKNEADMKTVGAAIDNLMNQCNMLQQQNIALSKAFTAATAGIRVGFAPGPIVPSMPGQPIDVGVPTHAFRPQHAELVAGGEGAPPVREINPDTVHGPKVTPMGERLSYADKMDEMFYGPPGDSAFYSGGDDE